MLYQLDSDKEIGLMEFLAKRSGSKIKNGLFILPDTIGKGYIKTIHLGSMMKLIINRCEFKKEIKLDIQGNKSKNDFITFSFRNVFLPEDIENENSFYGKKNVRLLPSVQVGSWGMNIEVNIPAKIKVSSILIHTHVDELKTLFNKEDNNFLIQKITSGNQPLLYEEIISPEIQNTAAKILSESGMNELQDFFYKLKAQELIFLFFSELLKRKDAVNYPINRVDVTKLYEIRDLIISDLTRPPKLEDLATTAGMSESKMNKLFKQVFGTTIYNYHQKLRMNEAAYLIKEKSISISEVGYQLGFSNLSHFTRIFEKHIGFKPKKYSLQ